MFLHRNLAFDFNDRREKNGWDLFIVAMTLVCDLLAKTLTFISLSSTFRIIPPYTVLTSSLFC